ncbi:MAG: hypothetical protein ACXVQR_03630 [Solirubrobacteraceae bacterium]
MAGVTGSSGHCDAGSPAGLLVVRAYPNGMRWDIRRANPDEREEVLTDISQVPLLDQGVRLKAGHTA